MNAPNAVPSGTFRHSTAAAAKQIVRPSSRCRFRPARSCKATVARPSSAVPAANAAPSPNRAWNGDGRPAPSATAIPAIDSHMASHSETPQTPSNDSPAET